jgi:uncharacterized phage protein (TIGR01671 family)
MSREIKFRGKNQYTGEWVYGHYFQLEGIHRIQKQEYKGAWYEVNPETIGEFTGIRDRKGSEVYEGDLIMCNPCVSDTPLLINFVGSGFSIVNPNCCKKCKQGEGCIMTLDEIGGDFEVFGNIYEHSDLLTPKP